MKTRSPDKEMIEPLEAPVLRQLMPGAGVQVPLEPLPVQHVLEMDEMLGLHPQIFHVVIPPGMLPEGGKVTLTAAFTVLLEEHGIAIPKIVYQKIAEEISVELVATLTAQEG